MKDAFKLPSLSRNASPSRPAADTNTTTGTTITSSSISSDPAAALSTVPPTTTTAAPQPGSHPSKFPFLSSGNKSTSSEQLRSSGRIELNAIDVDAPASKDSIPTTTVPTSSTDARLIAEAKSDAKIVDPPLPEKIQKIETAVTPLNNLAIKADEKSDVNKPMKLPNPAISKKPTLSVAAAVQIKQQQQQQQLQSQEKLTPRDMDPSLVMINDEKPSDFGFRALPTVGAVGTGGIGIAEKGLFAPDPSEAAPMSAPGKLSINTTAIKDELPPPYHRSSTPTALTQKQDSSRYNSSLPNLDSTSTSVSFAPNIIDQAPPAAESPDAAPSVTRPESTTNPPRPQRSLSFNNRPMSTNSNRKFLSGRGLASRIRKNSGNSNTVSPREGYLPSNATNPQTNSIETATGESNAQKRLAQLLQRSQTVNQSLAAHQTSFPNLQQFAKGEEPKRQTMADRLIHDMKSLYKQRHSEEIGSSSNSTKDDRVGGDANRTKQLSFGLFSGIGPTERESIESDGAHTLDSTGTEDPLPLLQSYWHQLKDTITPRSLFLTPKDFDYFQTLITAAKPDVDIEAIMKKKAIFHSSSQPIYKYDELNRYYDEVHTFHQSPLVRRMLAIIEQQEKVQEDLLAKQQQPASDFPFSLNNNNKKQRVITPIHYIPDPLFGIHIFNTNLLFSHLDEFLRQKQKTQQQQKNQLLLDITEPLIQSPPSNYVVTASAHTHVRYQMNPQVLYNVIHQNLFYTELQSILAIKYSGFLQKYLLSSNPTANTRFKQRFFTLMVVPIKNPNIRAAFKLPPVVSSNTIDGGEEREEQVQEEWEYILVEYRRMSESSWGNIPLQFKRFYYLKELLYIFIDSNKGKEGKEFTICFRITTESATELDLPLPTDRKVMKHVANLENVKDIPPIPASNSTTTITKPAEHGRLERQQSVGKRESGTTSNLKDAVAKIDAIDAPGTVLSVDTASKIDDIDAKRKPSLERRNSKSKITQTAYNAKPTNNPPLSDNPKSATPADGKVAKEDPEDDGDDGDDGDEEEDEIFGDDDEDENENPVAPSSYHYRPGTTIPTNDAPPPLTPVSSTNPLHPSPEINQIIQNKKIKHDRWIKVTLLANSANERVQWVQILQSVAPANVYINTLNYQ